MGSTTPAGRFGDGSNLTLALAAIVVPIHVASRKAVFCVPRFVPLTRAISGVRLEHSRMAYTFGP